MKKYHLVYSFLLLLIVSSCEKAILEDDNSATQAVTRNIPSDFAYYNSYFLNLNTTRLDDGIGTISMTGDINTYAEGVEYDFTLYSQIKGDVKCVAWTSGELIRDGKNVGSIFGETGKKIKFTIRFHRQTTKVQLALETDNNPNLYKEASARLIIDRVRYNGEPVYSGGSPEGFSDLNVQARYHYHPDSGTGVETWICSGCRTRYLINESCRLCN